MEKRITCIFSSIHHRKVSTHSTYNQYRTMSVMFPRSERLGEIWSRNFTETNHTFWRLYTSKRHFQQPLLH